MQMVVSRKKRRVNMKVWQFLGGKEEQNAFCW